MIEIPVPVGELFDKITILRIKKEKGLDTNKELELLENKAQALCCTRIILSHVELLHSTNKLLWDIEDDKRAHESRKDFGVEFVELARLVYILNDHRALLKRQINLYSNSELTEVKKHTEY